LLVWSLLTPVDALSSPGLPTASVEPSLDSATLTPKTSLKPVLDAFTYEVWLHVEPARPNT
jgi:hypothetical protein